MAALVDARVELQTATILKLGDEASRGRWANVAQAPGLLDKPTMPIRIGAILSDEILSAGVSNR